MQKKIIHIAQSAGGVAEYLYMFLKNFTDKDYENSLIVSQDYENSKNKFEKLVNKLYIVPMQREIDLKKDFKSIREIKKILKIEKPDIVYLHSSKAGALGRIALLLNLKIKIIYNAHGWYFNADISKKKKKIFALIERMLAVRTNKIINISNNEYESAVKYKIAKENKMCVIENGIDFEKFKNCEQYRKMTREKFEISNNEIVIGVVGRISEQKDPLTLLKAFEILSKNYKNVKLMYVGTGDLEEQVIQFAKEHSIINKIVITGWVTDVEKYIPAFDIAVLPSKWEGFGLVLIEYMACDKPIIASNVGGITNIIQNELNGKLVNILDYKNLSECISELIECPAIRKNYIKANSKLRIKYDIKSVIKKSTEIFEEL